MTDSQGSPRRAHQRTHSTHLREVAVVEAEDEHAALAEAPRQQRAPGLVPNRPGAARHKHDGGAGALSAPVLARQEDVEAVAGLRGRGENKGGGFR